MGLARWFCIALVGLFACASSACAGIIGIDVANNANSYVGPGVLDTSSRAWTVKTGNSTFTLDSQTVTLVFGGNSIGTVNATIDLFDDYKHNGGGSAFGVVLTGLDMTKTYNLVVYGAQNFAGGRGGSYQLIEPNLGTLSTTGDQQSTFVSGVNYVRWDNITPDNSLSDQRIRFLVGNGPEGIGILNGFELQVVPEPTTSAMLLFGSIGLWAMRKRK